jgi:hypothetical protein
MTNKKLHSEHVYTMTEPTDVRDVARWVGSKLVILNDVTTYIIYTPLNAIKSKPNNKIVLRAVLGRSNISG